MAGYTAIPDTNIVASPEKEILFSETDEIFPPDPPTLLPADHPEGKIKEVGAPNLVRFS